MQASQPPVQIRQLTQADLEDFRAIRLAALQDAPTAFGSVHAVESARPLSAFAERLAGSRVFGAHAGGEIVGMVGLARETGLKDRHKGFLWGMYVQPAWRRHGVAAALMDALLAAAADEVEQVLLSVVQGNRAALAFYERHGFVAYGVEPRALKESGSYADEVLMVRFLATTPAGWPDSPRHP